MLGLVPSVITLFCGTAALANILATLFFFTKKRRIMYDLKRLRQGKTKDVRVSKGVEEVELTAIFRLLSLARREVCIFTQELSDDVWGKVVAAIKDQILKGKLNFRIIVNNFSDDSNVLKIFNERSGSWSVRRMSSSFHDCVKGLRIVIVDDVVAWGCTFEKGDRRFLIHAGDTMVAKDMRCLFEKMWKLSANVEIENRATIIENRSVTKVLVPMCM